MAIVLLRKALTGMTIREILEADGQFLARDTKPTRRHVKHFPNSPLVISVRWPKVQDNLALENRDCIRQLALDLQQP